jgi:excisionase family DNA binding protein
MQPLSQQPVEYLDIDELAQRTGLPVSTLWRLKHRGRIPFFQPGGKGARVKFPANALELAAAEVQQTTRDAEVPPSTEQLPGPRPKWRSAILNTSRK